MRLLPDEPFIQQVALGSKHFRCQRPPVFPWPFSDEDLAGITAPDAVASGRPGDPL